MGKLDHAIKQFLSNPKNFADLFNMGLFKKSLVQPDRLEQLNPDLAAAMFRDSDSAYTSSAERFLDDMQGASILMEDNHATYLVMGAQYQINVHNAMPVRTLLETGLAYARQVREQAAKNKAASEQPESQALRRELNRPDTFLSGFRRSDRLHPVIILVAYFGEKPWTGPLSIGEMLSEEDRSFLRYTCDCRLNLVTPEDIPDRPEYHTSELWKLMTGLSAGHKGKKKLLALADNDAFGLVSDETLRLLETLLNTKLGRYRREGGYDMCRAIREIKEEIDGYQTQIGDFKTQIGDYRTQIGDYQTQIGNFQTQIGDYQTQIGDYQMKIGNFQMQMAEKDREIAELKARLGIA